MKSLNLLYKSLKNSTYKNPYKYECEIAGLYPWIENRKLHKNQMIGISKLKQVSVMAKGLTRSCFEGK